MTSEVFIAMLVSSVLTFILTTVVVIAIKLRDMKREEKNVNLLGREIDNTELHKLFQKTEQALERMLEKDYKVVEYKDSFYIIGYFDETVPLGNTLNLKFLSSF